MFCCKYKAILNWSISLLKVMKTEKEVAPQRLFFEHKIKSNKKNFFCKGNKNKVTNVFYNIFCKMLFFLLFSLIFCIVDFIVIIVLLLLVVAFACADFIIIFHGLVSHDFSFNLLQFLIYIHTYIHLYL